MTPKLLLASLVTLFVSTAASAQPQPIRPTPIFEVETLDAQTHNKITAVHIWVNGSWTVEDYRSGTAKTTSGRIGEEQLRTLRAELTRAPWQRRYVQIPCAPHQVETEYLVNGTVMYTDPACSELLDETSLQALAFARGFVIGAIPMPPASVTCAATGTPLVELADNERTMTVYRNGAWELEEHVAGRPSARQKRCLQREVINRIALDLDAATWTQTPVVHCYIAATDQTTVTVDGKVVFVERVCNPYKLDDLSARVLGEIEQTGWSRSPSCSNQGTPLVELDHRDARPHGQQRDVKVWSSGAWEVTATVDGRRRTSTLGCLTREVQKTIADDVAGAPWQVTRNQIACRAISTASTTVKINGKEIIVERVCPTETLDEVSSRKLAEIQNVLADATK